MIPITYLQGDATNPAPSGDCPAIIAHICNDEGVWGAGFVLAVSRRWREPERFYRAAFYDEPRPRLGLVQMVLVAPHLFVANMIAQRGLARPGYVPLQLDALKRCLHRLGDHAREIGAEVHMPRIGCGLAGGRWDEIEPLVQAELGDRGIAVLVYDLELRAGVREP